MSAAASPSRNRDLIIFVAGIVLGLLIALFIGSYQSEFTQAFRGERIDAITVVISTVVTDADIAVSTNQTAPLDQDTTARARLSDFVLTNFTTSQLSLNGISEHELGGDENYGVIVLDATRQQPSVTCVGIIPKAQNNTVSSLCDITYTVRLSDLQWTNDDGWKFPYPRNLNGAYVSGAVYTNAHVKPKTISLVIGPQTYTIPFVNGSSPDNATTYQAPIGANIASSIGHSVIPASHFK